MYVPVCVQRTGRRRQAVPLRPVARESGSRDTSEWFWNLYLKVFVTGIIHQRHKGVGVYIAYLSLSSHPASRIPHRTQHLVRVSSV